MRFCPRLFFVPAATLHGLDCAPRWVPSVERGGRRRSARSQSRPAGKFDSRRVLRSPVRRGGTMGREEGDRFTRYRASDAKRKRGNGNYCSVTMITSGRYLFFFLFGRDDRVSRGMNFFSYLDVWYWIIIIGNISKQSIFYLVRMNISCVSRRTLNKD